MTNLLLILLLLVGCDENIQTNIDEEYSILGNWTLDESTEICDYIDGECINCENKFGETDSVILISSIIALIPGLFGSFKTPTA